MTPKPLKILLIENEPLYAHSIQQMLQEVEVAEFALTHVETLDAAIASLKTAPVTVVLLDLSLLDAQGLETLKQMHSLHPDVPILALSSLKNTDITQRKQTEEKLTLYREIIANSNDAIAIISPQGYFLEQNKAHSLLMGYSDDELLGQSPAIFDTAQRFSVVFEELLKSGSYRGEIVIRNKSGALVNIELSAFAVQDDRASPVCYVGIARDITQRKLSEIAIHQSKEAAEAGSKAKSEFLATISHELRTPLHAILGLSQLLEQEIFGSLNSKQKEYITGIHNSAEHLLALINDILDLSKVEAGKEELMLRPQSVQKLCDYVFAIVRDRALTKGLQLTNLIDPQADVFIADERRVKQMLLNLLSNAIKFTTAGTVSLEIKKVSQGITFSVADTGIGIAPEQLKLLFQPFKQLDSQLNRQYEGSGLGLALTRQLARLHGGDVTVQSTLGQGSKFTLFLPQKPQ